LFFFGPKPMYSYAEIKAVWPLDGFEGLRQFLGNPEMGYKVAWSDRMISTYGGIWLGALAYVVTLRRLPRLPLGLRPSCGFDDHGPRAGRGEARGGRLRRSRSCRSRSGPP